jgi:hypothetical protein
MTDRYRERIPQDLSEIAELLHSRRPEAGPLELDRIKLRAKAARRRPVPQLRKGNGFMRSRVVSLLVVTGLLGGGTGALAAVGSGPFDLLSNDEGASHSQYCPPTSQQPGKPKKPGPARCGKEPPGHEEHGHGNGHGQGDDPGESQGHGHGRGNDHGAGNDHGNDHGQGEGQSHGHGHGNSGGKGNGKNK